jgi:hypothetical protein
MPTTDDDTAWGIIWPRTSELLTLLNGTRQLSMLLRLIAPLTLVALAMAHDATYPAMTAALGLTEFQVNHIEAVRKLERPAPNAELCSRSRPDSRPAKQAFIRAEHCIGEPHDS